MSLIRKALNQNIGPMNDAPFTSTEAEGTVTVSLIAKVGYNKSLVQQQFSEVPTALNVKCFAYNKLRRYNNKKMWVPWRFVISGVHCEYMRTKNILILQ